ncbi:MAG: PDZ domain-containing protein [Fuerstiella sp.]
MTKTRPFLPIGTTSRALFLLLIGPICISQTCFADTKSPAAKPASAIAVSQAAPQVAAITEVMAAAAKPATAKAAATESATDKKKSGKEKSLKQDVPKHGEAKPAVSKKAASQKQPADHSAASSKAAHAVTVTVETTTTSSSSSSESSSTVSADTKDVTKKVQQAKSAAKSAAVKAGNESKRGKDKSSAKRLKSIEDKLDKLAQQMQALSEMEATAKAEAGEPVEEPAETPSTKDEAKATKKPVVADRGKLPRKTKLDNQWLGKIPARSLGPANMSGRISDIAIHPEDSSLWYIGTAGGGLLKTTNQGVSLSHHFDDQNTVSIGAVAADPTNKDVVWVGTGEANPRNSVSYGDGIYKSTDGGKTFEHLGLKKTYQIGRILVDPKNSDTVYVGALGRLYGTNRERGVYKTTDGGKTWEHSLYVDDQTGVIDMVMHPKDPNIIIAALWNRMRDGFDSWPGSVKKPDGVDGYDPIRKYGQSGGLYKTTDGGNSWTKLSDGLPVSATGRIGLDWQTGGDNALVAIIDCETIGQGPKPFDVFLGIVGVDEVITKGVAKGKIVASVSQLIPGSPAEKAGVKVGDILNKIQGKDVGKFDDLLDVLRDKKIGQKLSFRIMRNGKPLDFETRLAPRPGSNQQMPTVWLGVTGKNNDDGKPELLTVSKNSPAEKATLKTGDIVVKVNEKDATTYEDLVKLVQAGAAGDKVKLEVARGEGTLIVDVELANRPSRAAQGRAAPARSNAIMGIQGRNATGEGAALTSITDGGPSEKAGLKTGDIVVKIDDKEVANYEALISEIRSRQPDDQMKVEVKRGSKKVTKTVTLGDRRGGDSKRPYTYSYFGQQPNIQDMQGAGGHLYGGIYKSTDAGETWQRVNSLNTRPMYFSVIKIDPNDAERLYVLGVSQFRSTDGGRTFSSDFGRSVHADAHDLWIDPSNGRHMVIAGDGGFYATYDYGSTWDHINTAAIGQFYHVAISPKEPYWVVGGLQDNGTWAGPAISRSGGAVIQDWVNVSGGDGFVARVDAEDPNLMYYESQNGNIGRRNLVTGERASIRPARQRGVEDRFNWNTPFILSSHNPKLFYSAGSYVFRSLNQGSGLQRISPEITRTKRGSATALSESPRDSNVLYVGSDDGALWVTKDGGANWTDITENLGLSDLRWVNTIEASRFETGRVYVVLDGHRSDDDNPYVFVSEDFGASFTPLHKGLPWGTTRCLREDIRNENLLYLGTEIGFHVSVDRGQSWSKFNQNLPVVAIHDVAIHPTNGEIVLATHGRSLWACDVTALRNIKVADLAKGPAFYKPQNVTRWRTQPSRGRTNRRYVAENPARGAQFWYSLPEDVEKVQVKITDVQGATVNTLTGSKEAGLQRLDWNLSRAARPRNGRPSGGFRGTGRGSIVGNGSYKATLIVDEEDVASFVIDVKSDPNLAAGAVSDEEYETMLLQDEMASKLKWDAKSEGRDAFKDD